MGNLHNCDGIINADGYVQVLEKHMPPFRCHFRDVYPSRTMQCGFGVETNVQKEVKSSKLARTILKIAVTGVINHQKDLTNTPVLRTVVCTAVT